MADLQTIMDAVAQIVGGTLVSALDPGFYSGYKTGDGSGVAGLHGCYSSAPETIQEPPVAVLLPGPFTAQLNVPELNTDNLKLIVFVGRVDSPTNLRQLVPFRDSIPAAFRAKMKLGLSDAPLYVNQAFVTRGDYKPYIYADQTYLAWEFTVSVEREPIYQYTA